MKARLDEAGCARARLGERIAAELAAARGLTLTAVLRARAAVWRQRTALEFRDRRWCYDELLARVDRARAVLQRKGVRPGQAVAFLMHNCDHYVAWYFAVLGLGAVAVPLNTRLVPREAAFILQDSGAVLLITEPAFVPLVRDMAQAHRLRLPQICIDPEDADGGLGAVRHDGEPELPEGGPAALYYTSGTTGNPKGVVHTHATLLAITLQSPSAWEYDFDGVRSLVVTPLFHIAAHTIFLPVLFIGGTLVIDSYDTVPTLHTIRDRAISAFFAVPSILLLMIEKAPALGLTLPGVRAVMFGAAPMTISKLGEVQALFPHAGMVHGMGQTESGGTLVTLPGFAAMARAGSIGLPMAGVEVAIFDDQDQPVPAGTVGELVARGPNVMARYHGNPQASAETLRHGWLHTGDLGYQDADGLVTLVDRKKDMIIRGGENIYSCEVEQVLARHPAVLSVAVVGQSDTIFGEQVAAFVVTDPARPRPTEDALAEHCRQALADYKLPVTYRFLDALPLTATGKIRKAELRAALGPYQRPTLRA